MVDLDEIKNLCISGLRTDGGHHKQWFLEEILKELGYDLEKISREICKEDASYDNEDPDEYWEQYNYDGLFWEKGVPP